MLRKNTNLILFIFIVVCWDYSSASLPREERECFEYGEKKTSWLLLNQTKGLVGQMRFGGQNTHLTITILASSTLKCNVHTRDLQISSQPLRFSHSFKRYLINIHEFLGKFFRETENTV